MKKIINLILFFGIIGYVYTLRCYDCDPFTYSSRCTDPINQFAPSRLCPRDLHNLTLCVSAIKSANISNIYRGCYKTSKVFASGMHMENFRKSITLELKNLFNLSHVDFCNFRLCNNHIFKSKPRTIDVSKNIINPTVHLEINKNAVTCFACQNETQCTTTRKCLKNQQCFSFKLNDEKGVSQIVRGCSSITDCLSIARNKSGADKIYLEDCHICNSDLCNSPSFYSNLQNTKEVDVLVEKISKKNGQNIPIFYFLFTTLILSVIIAIFTIFICYKRCKRRNQHEQIHTLQPIASIDNYYTQTEDDIYEEIT